jgi:hypothetical protein
MEATRSSETAVLTRPTRRHVPGDGIIHSHRCENLKSYKYASRFQWDFNDTVLLIVFTDFHIIKLFDINLTVSYHSLIIFHFERMSGLKQVTSAPTLNQQRIFVKPFVLFHWLASCLKEEQRKRKICTLLGRLTKIWWILGRYNFSSVHLSWSDRRLKRAASCGTS